MVGCPALILGRAKASGANLGVIAERQRRFCAAERARSSTFIFAIVACHIGAVSKCVIGRPGRSCCIPGSEVLYVFQPSCCRVLSRPILTCATPSGAKSGAKAAMP